MKMKPSLQKRISHIFGEAADEKYFKTSTTNSWNAREYG